MSPAEATTVAGERLKLDAAKMAALLRSLSHGEPYKRLAPRLGMSRATLCRLLAREGLVRHLGLSPVPGREAKCAVALRLLRARGSERQANARRLLDCLELLHLREVSGVVRWEDWGRICAARVPEGEKHEERLTEARRRAFFRLADWLAAEARIRLTTDAGQWIDGRRVVSFSLRRLRLFVGRRDGRVERRALEVLGYGDDGDCDDDGPA